MIFNIELFDFKSIQIQIKYKIINNELKLKFNKNSPANDQIHLKLIQLKKKQQKTTKKTN